MYLSPVWKGDMTSSWIFKYVLYWIPYHLFYIEPHRGNPTKVSKSPCLGGVNINFFIPLVPPACHQLVWVFRMTAYTLSPTRLTGWGICNGSSIFYSWVKAGKEESSGIMGAIMGWASSSKSKNWRPHLFELQNNIIYLIYLIYSIKNSNKIW